MQDRRPPLTSHFPRVDDDDDDDSKEASSHGTRTVVNSPLDQSMDSSTSTTVSTSVESPREISNPPPLINTHLKPTNQPPMNYVRLPHALRSQTPSFYQSSPSNPIRSGRRSFPLFESVRTPMQRSPIPPKYSSSAIPSMFLDCCQE